MTILLFLFILLILVLSHEFGHFIVAKMFKIRVDEFAFGFSPRLFAKKFGETTYAFNALPLGGYVKIYGEDPTQVTDDADKKRSFGTQALWKQALVIIAGVVFNLLLAWILFTVIFLIGAPSTKDNDFGLPVENAQLTITGMAPGSPAQVAGLKEGDVIVSLSEGGAIKEVSDADGVQTFIAIRENKDVTFNILRGKEKIQIVAVPHSGIVPGHPAVGIYMDDVGTIRLPFFTAIKEGGKRTVDVTIMTATGIYDFFKHIVIGKSDFSQVSGPVGIVSAVGDAAKLGLINVIFFTALISINLAVINVIPFPALDGGRLVFVIVEAIIRKPLPVRFANITNIVGFALLMLLMLVVTYHDVVKFF